MASKEKIQSPIDQIKKKQAEIANIQKLIELYSARRFGMETRAKIDEIKDRLEFRLAQLELSAMDVKIECLTKILRIMQTLPK